MLPNGSPIVGSSAPPPFQEKKSTFVGHLCIDKIKQQTQREMREAVSTSHCSQPNTIEYEMAMEWCVLQSRSERWWKQIYMQQGVELRKLKANLKLK
ncbi:protein ANTI-SILENCING 1-like isoform X2 [Actinidia eriantha]|nr:protein ANTI-SILENCING 1-like isoform X2 [Actinidia eriantha]